MPETADRHRLIFEQTHDLIVVLDDRGRLLDVSPSCRDVLGWEPAELAGTSWLDLVHPDDRVAAEQRLERARAGEETPAATRRVRHRDDRWVLLDGGTFTFTEPAGGERIVVGVLRDTTERTENERRFRTLLDHAPEAIVVLDVDQGRFVDANPKALALFGADRDTLLSLGVAELSPELQPDGRSSLLAAAEWIEQAVQGGTPSFDWVHRTLDGREIACEVRLVHLPSAGGTLVRGSITDVSERRDAEARRSALFEDASVGMAIVSAEGRFLATNAALEEMIDYTGEELRRMSFLDITHRDDAKENAALWRQRLEAGTFHMEKRYVRRDGSVVWVDVSSRILPGELGEPPVAYSVIQDVTERKRLEEELRQAQKMEAVGRLAGGIAHDFNNLLTAITGYSEILLVELPEDDPRRMEALEIRNAAERAATLTGQLLAFSRRQMLRPELLDLNEVVRRIETLVGRLIGEDVELVTELADAPATMRADPGQIEQVLMNLAVNARDAMPRGGRLTISTEVLESRIVLEASDTGIGMNEETKSRIFEPFFTTKGQGKGTGLGLATVYGIVEQSGGTLSVESAPGRGTTFTINFPRVRDDQAERPSEELDEARGGTETVLLVEDEEVVRTLARRVLAQSGYQVLEAAFGIEALEVADAHDGPIDLLLTDVVMPGLSGPELAERIQERNPRIRTLFMSGFADLAEVRIGDDGAVIDKPFTPEELLRAIRSVLARTDLPA